MPRYAIRRPSVHSNWVDDDGPRITAIEVHEPEEPTDTGIVDKDGNAIMRLRDPIGFRLRRDD